MWAIRAHICLIVYIFVYRREYIHKIQSDFKYKYFCTSIHKDEDIHPDLGMIRFKLINVHGKLFQEHIFWRKCENTKPRIMFGMCCCFFSCAWVQAITAKLKLKWNTLCVPARAILAQHSLCVYIPICANGLSQNSNMRKYVCLPVQAIFWNC